MRLCHITLEAPHHVKEDQLRILNTHAQACWAWVRQHPHMGQAGVRISLDIYNKNGNTSDGPLHHNESNAMYTHKCLDTETRTAKPRIIQTNWLPDPWVYWNILQSMSTYEHPPMSHTQPPYAIIEHRISRMMSVHSHQNTIHPGKTNAPDIRHTRSTNVETLSDTNWYTWGWTAPHLRCACCPPHCPGWWHLRSEEMSGYAENTMRTNTTSYVAMRHLLEKNEYGNIGVAQHIHLLLNKKMSHVDMLNGVFEQAAAPKQYPPSSGGKAKITANGARYIYVNIELEKYPQSRPRRCHTIAETHNDYAW